MTYQREQSAIEQKLSLEDSFPPTPGFDNRDWARISMGQLNPAFTESGPVVSSQTEAQARFTQPQNTDQTISFLRIGQPGHRDRRQRLQSVGSTLSAHTIQPSQSSEALGGFRADRIGSVIDPSLAPRSRRNTGITFLEDTGRTGSKSTVASRTPPSVGSFKIERAQRASVSVRKVSVGGNEDLVPVSLIHNQSLEPVSPPDLDTRFARPLLAGFRPPSQIDFTQPFGNMNPQITRTLPTPPEPSYSPSHFSGNRESVRSYDKRKSIEPALPSSRICSPAQPLPKRQSIPLDKLESIPHSPLVSPKTNPEDKPKQTGTTHPGHTRSTSNGHKRMSSVKKKRRPDSIDLAILRSPKLAPHHPDHLAIPSISPPALTAALNELKCDIASSVIALKSGSTSAHFLHSAPSTPGSKMFVNPPRTPKTPRTATSEGGHSFMSDLESGHLLQAWRGFRAPTSPDMEDPSIRRSMSARMPGNGPKIAIRAATADGDLSVEVVSNGHTTPVPQLSRHYNTHTFDGDQTTPTGLKDDGTRLETGVTSLKPSPSSSRSGSPQPKITYLSEVVKENEKRLSLVGNRSN